MPFAVIMDMDGLLLDTEPLARRVWKQAARELGHELDEETCDRMVGLNQAANRQMLLGRLGASFPVEDLIVLAQARYREALEEGVPHKAGLLDFIRFLDEREIPR